MATENENKYHVVKFLELPYEHMSSHYACVPHSWVRRSTEWRVNVAYPREDPVKTRKRVGRRESYEENWKQFVAVVKYDTNDFDDAEVWIQTMDDDDAENERLVIDISEDPIDFTNSEINATTRDSNGSYESRRSNNMEFRGDQSTPSMNTTENTPCMESESSRTNGNPPKQLSLKRPLPLYARRGIQKKLSKIYIPNVESSIRKHKSNQEYYSDQASPTEKRNVQTRTEVHVNQRFPSRRNTNTSNMPTSKSPSNQTCQSPRKIHNQRISVVPDEILFHGRKYYGNEEKAYHQGSVENTFVLKDWNNLVKLQSHLIQCSHENPPTIVNEDLVHQEPQIPIVPDQYSTEINPISQRTNFQDSRNNTLSNLRKFRNLVNHSRKFHEQAHDEQQPLPSHRHDLQQDSCPDPVTVIETSEKRYVDQNSKSVNRVLNNASTFEQNLSSIANQSCQVSESSYIKESPSDYNILVRQDPNINQIIITRSVGVECNDTIMPAQSTINNTPSDEQNSLNVLNLPCQIPGRSSEELFLQYPRAPKSVVSPMTREVSLKLNDTIPDNIKNPPPAGHHSSNLRISQLSKTAYENGVPTKLRNYLNQHTHPHRPLAGESVVHNQIDQRTHFQGIAQNKPYPVQKSSNLANDLNQRYKRPSEKQFPPIINGYLLRDQYPGTLFLKESTEAVSFEQRHNDASNESYIEDYSKNMPSVRHYVMPTLANQSAQYFERLHERLHAPGFEDYPLPNSHNQEVFYGRNVVMSDASQIIVPNTPCPLQHSSNFANCICTCKCSHRNIFTPSNKDNWLLNRNAYRDPRLQQTVYERNSIARNRIDRSVYPEIQKCSLQQKPENRHAERNYVYQNVSPETNTRDRPATIQNCRNITKQFPIDEQSPIDIDSSDQEMSPEEISIRRFRKANNTGIERNSHPERNKTNRSTDIQRSPTAVYELSNNRAVAEEVLLNYLKNFFRTMDTSFSDKRAMCMSMIDTIIVECSEIFQRVMKRIIDYGETMAEPTANTSKGVTVNKDQPNRNKGPHNYIEDDDDDQNYPVCKKKRGHIS